MKFALCEIKKNLQGTNSDGKETRTQINVLERKEERNIQPKQNEETRIQKNEERLRNLQDNLNVCPGQTFQHPNQRGARRRRAAARNWKLIWTNNEGELPQSGKGNRLSGSPGSSESPKEVDPRRNTPRHIIIKLLKIKDKERILKAAREKDTVIYKGVPIRLSADFSKETLQARRGWKGVSEVMKGKDLHPRIL